MTPKDNSTSVGDNPPQVVLVDRYDRRYPLSARAGQRLSTFLVEKYIPRDAIIAYCDGVVVDDQRHILQPGNNIELKMVRSYQLPEFDKMLGLWEPDRAFQKLPDEHIYTKKVLWFNDNGICELRQRSFTPESFVPWLEDTFVEGILSKNLIRDGDKILLALSGGRDSVALLYLLNRCRSRLPKCELQACTVECIASSRLDVEIAQESAKNAGVDKWHVLDEKDIEEIFRLKVPYRQAIDTLFAKYGRAKSIFALHHITRTCVESCLKEIGFNTLGMGLHLEDRMAGALWAVMLGWPFEGSAAGRNYGPFRHVYPLWSITKKELTLYLEQVAPQKHSSQGGSVFTDRGDHNRDLNYFLSDAIQTLFPGFAHHLFDGLEKMVSRVPSSYLQRECEVCHGFFQPDRTQDPSLTICHVCSLFSALELSA